MNGVGMILLYLSEFAERTDYSSWFVSQSGTVEVILIVLVGDLRIDCSYDSHKRRKFSFRSMREA